MHVIMAHFKDTSGLDVSKPRFLLVKAPPPPPLEPPPEEPPP